MAKVLDAVAITAPVTAATSSAVASGTGLSSSLLVVIDFVYGSGGTSGKVWVQTSLDGGTTWVDIANMTFLLASKKRVMNLTSSPITAPYTPTDGTLADDTVRDGLTGGVYRTKLTTIGTYAATTLSVTVIPGEG